MISDTFSRWLRAIARVDWTQAGGRYGGFVALSVIGDELVSVVVGRGLISVVVTSGFVPDIIPDIVVVIFADGLTSAADTGGFTFFVLLTFFTASASIPFVSSPFPRPFSATLFERTSLTSFSSSRPSSTSFIYSHKPREDRRRQRKHRRTRETVCGGRSRLLLTRHALNGRFGRLQRSGSRRRRL